MLSETTNALGQTVRTVIDATGNIVEQVVGDAGQIVSSNVRKSVLDFPVVKSGRNTLGQVVETRKVRYCHPPCRIGYVFTFFFLGS